MHGLALCFADDTDVCKRTLSTARDPVFHSWRRMHVLQVVSMLT